MKKGLIFVGLFLILSLSVFVSSEETFCKDTDSGINLFVKGITSSDMEGIYGEVEDECISNPGTDYQVLKENYCGENGIHSLIITCSEGCENGICLGASSSVPECIDSDNGPARYVKGNIEGPEFTGKQEDLAKKSYYEDSCSEKLLGEVTEYSCENGLIISTSYECENGCSEGKCISVDEKGECTESDRGKDYYVKGEIKAWNLANEIETDICNTEEDLIGSLREFYCDDGSATETRFLCPNGCSDGACLGGEVEDVELILDEGFRHATWECYDGTQEAQGEESLCKSAELWRYDAGNFCIDKCDGDGNMCGVSSFSVSNECLLVGGVDIISTGSLEEYLEELERVVGELLILVGESELTNAIEPLIYDIEENEGLSDRINVLVERLKQLEIQLESDDELRLFNEAKSLTNRIKERLSGSFEETSFGEDILICQNSCPFEDSCLPIGVRANGKYCSIQGELVSQLEGDAQCDNSFECGSNLCIDNQCVESGLFIRIINWFKNIFGGE